MKKKEPKLTLKQRAWLDSYVNCFNATQAARDAGYRCKVDARFRSIGAQNYAKLRHIIEEWIEGNGLSDKRLKSKLIKLIDSKQTIFQKLKGAVDDKILPENHKLAITTGVIEHDKDGNNIYGDGESLIEIEVDAIETQRRSLDMALKVKGLYASEKHQLSGDPDNPLKWEIEIKDARED